MNREEKIKEIMDAYRIKSEELFEANLDASLAHLSDVVNREEFQMRLRKLGLDKISEWVESGRAREHMKEIYPTHTKNFGFIFYENEDGGIARLTRALIGTFGFDFDREARDLRQYLESKLDMPVEEIVGTLLRERGLYAAKAIIGDAPKIDLVTGPAAMIEYVWMKCANEVCTADLKGRNKIGIDISGYDGWLVQN